MASAQRKPCPTCGEMIVAAARVCRFCGERFADDTEGDVTGGVIPYKNVHALIAYYCGVFSIIPCFPIGLVALVLGIMGLRNAARNPKVRGQVHAWIGIIAGGLFGIGYLVATVLLVIAAMTHR